MSIYATHWVLKFPEAGDWHPNCAWVEVIGQGVPAHIGTPTPGYGYESGDPYRDFLPPPVPVLDIEDGVLRAMVIVRGGSVKVGQRYEKPLVVMSGVEYASTPFDTLYERIIDTLRHGT